jgi:hypothetical protein
MLRGSVLTKEFPQLQQQHQRHRTAERHSETSVKVKNPVTDYKVEYNFACFKDYILFFKIIGLGKVSNGILYPK